MYQWFTANGAGDGWRLNTPLPDEKAGEYQKQFVCLYQIGITEEENGRSLFMYIGLPEYMALKLRHGNNMLKNEEKMLK